ncbi:MAG: SDR family oxidoreductase [Anaerolineales bacterium]|nr:SDR family oxidoreductase [Chloroflexota bacterium]MBL6980716.1 SDR family oxidoreductase [Anaerolineales bacterium]
MSSKPVILITGASSGIGEATARLFGMEKGYRVVLAARRMERLEALAEEIRSSGGDALPAPTDITQIDQIEKLMETALAEYGQVDVLLNNAGFGRLKWLEQLDPRKDIELQLQVNLSGVIQTTRALLPHMIERKLGHIINMASVAGLTGTPTYTIYAATKFGVRGFTEALRREVKIWGIDVSGIYPGSVSTEFQQHMGAERKTGITTPQFMRLTPQDVAQAVYRVVRRPRRMMILPWYMRFSYLFNLFLPGVVDYTIHQGFTKRERG